MKKTAPISAMAAPQLDSVHGEREEDEAEKMRRLDLLCGSSSDGDAAASSLRARPWQRKKWGRGKISEGERMRAASWCSYAPRRAEERRGGLARRGRASWGASSAPGNGAAVSTGERTAFCEKPPAFLFPSQLGPFLFLYFLF